MSNKLFNIMRTISELAVPIAAFIVACGEAIGIPTDAAVKIITAFGVLLGACISIMRGVYNGGDG